VNLDNITFPLDSADLARALTQSEYQDRLLGVSRMLRLLTNTMWTCTGNNLVFRGDLPSRAVVCRIDPGEERPEERQFLIEDLPDHLRCTRKRLITAALTILRAYQVAGRPRQDIPRWGGFDHWSREIRAPLVWLGLPDPYVTRERVIVNDPERDAALGILALWHEQFGDRAMLVAEVIRETTQELKAQLSVVAASRKDPESVDPRALGTWCASVEGRVYGEFKLCRMGSVRRATTWRVSCVSSVSQKPPGESGGKNGEQNGAACSPGFGRREDLGGSDSPNSPDSHGGQSDLRDRPQNETGNDPPHSPNSPGDWEDLEK